MRKIALLLLVLSSFAALAEEALKTVILIRHAEKASDAENPPLNDAGKARAEELVRILGASGITVIYTTQFIRTQDTAKPLAAALGLEPVIVQTSKTYPADVAARIHETKPGATILVVGHSNTTINVIRELGIKDVRPIADSDYDELFVVTLGGGAPKLLTLRYGKETS